MMLALSGCGPSGTQETARAPVSVDSTFAVPVEWLADSARTMPLPVEAPPRVWVARVTPASAPPPEPDLPDPLPAVPAAPPPPPRLEIDPGLRPPIPKRPARIEAGAWPEGPAWVELEVEVDPWGRVGAVAWAGGSRDSALVDAAIECARTMAFFPAMRAGEPVAVRCLQRFDFARRD